MESVENEIFVLHHCGPIKTAFSKSYFHGWSPKKPASGFVDLAEDISLCIIVTA